MRLLIIAHLLLLTLLSWARPTDLTLFKTYQKKSQNSTLYHPDAYDWMLPQDEDEGKIEPPSPAIIAKIMVCAGAALLFLHQFFQGCASVVTPIFSWSNERMHDTGVSVELIPVACQKEGATCGYHAFYNALVAARQLRQGRSKNDLIAFFASEESAKNIQELFADGSRTEVGALRQQIIEKRQQQHATTHLCDEWRLILQDRILIIKEKNLPNDSEHLDFKIHAKYQTIVSSVIRGLVKDRTLVGWNESEELKLLIKRRFDDEVSKAPIKDEAIRELVQDLETQQRFVTFERIDQQCVVALDSAIKAMALTAQREQGDWLKEEEFEIAADTMIKRFGAADIYLIPSVDHLDNLHNSVYANAVDTHPNTGKPINKPLGGVNTKDGAFGFSDPKKIKDALRKKEVGSWACVLGTMATEGSWGHWYALVVHQNTAGQRFYYVMDSFNSACHIQKDTLVDRFITYLEEGLERPPKPVIDIVDPAHTSGLPIAEPSMWTNLLHLPMGQKVALSLGISVLGYWFYHTHYTDKQEIQEDDFV